MNKHGPSLSRRRLIQAVSHRAQISQEDVETVLDAFLDVLAKAMRDGLSVTFRNFGIFGVTIHKAQRFVRPKTKEEELLPPRAVPHFYPCRRYVKEVRAAYAERGDLPDV